MTDHAARGESVDGLDRFEDIYRENFPFVWAAAHRCGVPAEAVDDVVQDVFITAHRRMHELDWEVSAHGWLYGVTRNVAMRHRRGAVRRGRREAQVAQDSTRAVHPHRRLDAARTLEVLLEQVRPPQREVFEMAELLGMSAPEIAAELGVPANTVYSRLRLARKQLKALAGGEEPLRGEVEQAREACRPSAQDRKRTLAALAPMLKVPWWSTLGLMPKIGLVAAATIGLVVGVSRTPPRPRVLSTSLTASAPRQVPAPRQPALSAPVPTAEPSAPSSPPSQIQAPRGGKRRLARSAGQRREDAEPTSALADEVALLDLARAQLSRGDAEAALRTLDDYDARFPGGQLQSASRRTRCRAQHGANEKCSSTVTDRSPGGER